MVIPALVWKISQENQRGGLEIAPPPVGRGLMEARGVQCFEIETRYKHLHSLSIDITRQLVVPSVAEWLKARDFDVSAGGESPVRAPVRAATLCPYVY